MDSLTQIVLGAAVGEAVAGKRIGNRAMVWGAIGGTIPDLDVLANLWMREIDALAVHRGITHSMTFSVLAPVALGWLVFYLYRSGAHKSLIYKWIIAGINILLIALLVTGNYWITGSIPALIILGIIAGYLVWRLYKYYVKKPAPDVPLTFWGWYILFFAAFFTHILLDCFTTYGTQALLPFSRYRVAFNTISVVDPMYTIPFIVCLIVAAIHRRDDPARSFANWLGIALSTLYLCVTVVNKQHINRVFESTLEKQEIDAIRWQTNPTIFNNILWNCLAEAPNEYYWGLYSLYDSKPEVGLLNRFEKDPASIEILQPHEEFQTLRWFSDDFFITRPAGDGYEFIDLRYGAMTDSLPELRDFVFRFSVLQHAGRLEVHQIEDRPDNFGEAFGEFVERIKGR